MARPRSDGSPSRAPRKAKLSDAVVRSLKPEAKPFLVWDEKLAGFCVCVQPSGHKAFKVIYWLKGRARWFTIGNARRIDFDNARNLAARALLQVAQGIDVQAERRAKHDEDTFEDLAIRYRDEYAKQKNKSWKETDRLVQTNLMPRWAKLCAIDITRADVRSLLARYSKKPTLANRVRASASAIFAWAVKEELLKINPCTGIEPNKLQSRDRVLSDSVPRILEWV
jgi:hypothetical protein